MNLKQAAKLQTILQSIFRPRHIWVCGNSKHKLPCQPNLRLHYHIISHSDDKTTVLVHTQTQTQTHTHSDLMKATSTPFTRTVSYIYLLLVLFSLSIFTLSSCKKDKPDGPDPITTTGDPLHPGANVSTTLVGTVIDEEGQPVEAAEILVAGQYAYTNDKGTFVIENIDVPENRFFIKATKVGYFTGSRALAPLKDKHTEATIVLMRNDPTHTFDASAGINATLFNGCEVKIPANGLVTADGSAYDGQVNMSVRYLDPSKGNFGVLVAGGDMLAKREDNSTSILYSFGILRVTMTSPGGQELQLASGKTSSITMSIPDDMLASAPQTIPLWYFDEVKGYWVEEGSATKQGNKYIGSVSHFTDWNCDEPKGFATIIGRLVDCNGKPAWGQVEFGQIASDPQSAVETGQSDGKFSQRVPTGVSITVTISDPLIISPLTQDERGKVIVIVPPLTDGQVYDVGDIQTFPCPAELTATFKLRTGDEVSHISFSTENGIKTVVPSGSTLKTSITPRRNIRMFISTKQNIIYTKNITTPDERQTLDLGEIDLSNGGPTGNEVTISGKIECYGNADDKGQVSIHFAKDGQNKIEYTVPNADGSFSIQAPTSTTVEIKTSTQSGNHIDTIQTPAQNGAKVNLGVIELCQNSKIGATGFTITGDGFNNTSKTIITNKNSMAFSYAMYTGGSMDFTQVMVGDLGDTLDLYINFPGKATGGFDNTSEGASIRIERKKGTVEYISGYVFGGSTLNLNITKYNAVGGAVEGTFSGTFLIRRNNVLTTEKVTITNGKFSALRYKDIF